MNDQHRATDSEWHCIKARGCGSKADVVAYSTIYELLCRIEALEAAQQAYADASHVIDPERQKMAQESSQAAGFAPRWPEVKLRAATTAQPNHPEIPGGSLLSRVACADGPADAIREIAAWLREQYGGLTATSELLEHEAER